MHPWHDIYVDDHVIGAVFPVVIEVPMGSSNKYELDKDSGLLRLDRVLFSAVYYPGQEPVHPMTVVEARAIGVMRMRDEKGLDDKILAVSVRDPAVSDYTVHTQLPQHQLRQIKRFFEDYKTLEHKQVVVEDFMDPEEALKILEDALDLYRRLRRGEIERKK
jgi:inorganic pyrophosphatase